MMLENPLRHNQPTTTFGKKAIEFSLGNTSRNGGVELQECYYDTLSTAASRPISRNSLGREWARKIYNYVQKLN